MATTFIIAYNKAIMNVIICDSYYLKKQIREAKHAIKALRKQIAMRPITKRANGDDYRKCPHCGRYLWRIEDDIYYDYPPKYCEDCGQKLVLNDCSKMNLFHFGTG